MTEDESFFEISLYPSCTEPGKERPCSGHGICIDGSCNCDSLEDIDPLYRYSGKYCEECPYCNGQRCEKIFKCLKECQENEMCYNTSCGLPFIAAKSYAVTNNRSLDEKRCLIEDENGCYINFKYVYENGVLMVFKSDKRDCYNGCASK